MNIRNIFVAMGAAALMQTLRPEDLRIWREHEGSEPPP